MSASRGSGAGNGGGVQSIPLGSRKMVQSLKEIVNCSEAEIYATLKDCNMDPNETVNRLLGQDPFHEVKSKREKKKEGKDTSGPKLRSASNTSNRSSKSASDRYLGRGGSTPYNLSEPSPFHGKSTYKDNELPSYTNLLSSAHPMSGNSRSKEPLGFSDDAAAENKTSSISTADGTPYGGQSPYGYQSAWVGVTGQLSMADIVKMGRRSSKASNATQYNVQGSQAIASHENLKYSQDNSSKGHEPGVSSVQHVPTIDEWPSIEKREIYIPEYNVDSEVHQEVPSVPFDRVNQQQEEDEFQETENDTIENLEAVNVEPLTTSSRKIPEDDSGSASLFDNGLYQKMDTQLPQDYDFEHCEVEEVGASVPSVTRNLQQLSVTKDDRGFPSEGDTPSVVIPDHLQVHSADCSHLSFGSFKSGMVSSYSSGTMTSMHVKNNLEEAHSETDASSLEHADTRNPEYFTEDSLRNASDSSFFHRTDAHSGNYDASSASQPEEFKQENTEVTHGIQYPFPASNPGFNFDDAQHLHDAQHLNVSFSQTSSQMESLTPFSNVMHSYANSLPSTLLAANLQPIRESDIQYSPFSMTQSMSTKYGTSASSMGGPAMSMSEAMKTAGLSSTQPGSHNLSGTTVSTGPPMLQNLAVHPYSQPTLPLGPYGNMIGYPILPQTYPYMPSAFQQTFVGNSAYHQSLAAMLPQYKNSVSVSSLPQSAAIASGYGAFGNTSIPGNFSMNPSAAPSGTPLSYDDPLNTQYKDSNHLISLQQQQQQNENSAIWLHGHNSRTMSGVPASTYYNYQGQNQQPGGFRQGQQPSQNYGALVYPNLYHSQTGMLLDQQQNSRDGSLGSGGSQGQPKQSQIWQNSY